MIRKHRIFISAIAVGMVSLGWAAGAASTAAAGVPASTTLVPSQISLAAPEQMSLTAGQRLARLEQQVKYLNSLKLASEIQSLQQQLQKLSGQLQVQSHDIELLNKQQRAFYQDLNQKIQQLQNVSSSDTNGNTSSVPNALAAKNSGKTTVQVSESEAYQNAYHYVNLKQYDRAIKAFTLYQADYPNGQYLADANYWMGDIYLLQHQLVKAQAQLEIVITKYPKSKKVPLAQFKLAQVYAQQKKTAQATKVLTELLNTHPSKAIAASATALLQTLHGQTATTS